MVTLPHVSSLRETKGFMGLFRVRPERVMVMVKHQSFFTRQWRQNWDFSHRDPSMALIPARLSYRVHDMLPVLAIASLSPSG